jgi:hypothetical protein
MRAAGPEPAQSLRIERVLYELRLSPPCLRRVHACRLACGLDYTFTTVRATIFVVNDRSNLMGTGIP